MAKKVAPKKKKTPKKNVVKKVHEHLNREISITVGVVLVLLILILVKVPYNAQESYTETEPYGVEVQEVVDDLDNPMEVRVCDKRPANVRIEEDPFSPYIRPFGLNEYKCFAEFRVWNEEEQDGKWTFRYVFDISGKEIITDPVTKTVPAISSVIYRYEIDDCQEGDTVEGNYELVSGPTTEECHYETIYGNKTVTKTETKYRTVEKTRTITKYEALWQWIIGYNSQEKV